mgnify:CR=1 FL=1
MKLEFKKLSATGNDFIVIDNTNFKVSAENKGLWGKLCARRTGIGADGVLLIEPSEVADFRMRYINADGGEVEMCGNGARAISYAYAQLHPEKKELTFQTMNSVYKSDVRQQPAISIEMNELSEKNSIRIDDLEQNKHSLYLNTGVPHCIFDVDDVNSIDVNRAGAAVRYNSRFKNGTNVNFITKRSSTSFEIRTYERGVEDETLSCGTGITAAAIAFREFYTKETEISVISRGGTLNVVFKDESVFLKGLVEHVYSGECII